MSETNIKEVNLFHSLKFKFFIPTIFIILGVSTLIGYISLFILGRDKLNSLQERMESIGFNMNYFITADYNQIIQMLKNEVEEINELNNNKKKIAEKLYNEFKNSHEISIINKDYREEIKLINGESSDNLISFAENETLLELEIDDKIDSLSTEVFWTGNIPAIRTFYKIKDNQGNISGYINYVIYMNDIIQSVIKKDFEKTGFVMVVDKNGKIIYHKDKEFISKDLEENGRQKTDLITKITRLGTGFVRTKFMGTDSYNYYSPIKGTSWNLISTIPYNDFQKPFRKVILNIALIIIASIIMSLIILYFITVITTKSIGEIAKTLKIISMGEGDLTQQINIKANDEVKTISEYFNKILRFLNSMINRIKESVRSVKDISSDLASASEESTVSIQDIKSSIEGIKNKIQFLDKEITKSSEYSNDVNNFMQRVSDIITDETSDINESSSAIMEITTSIQTIDKVTQAKMIIVNNLNDLANAGEKEMDQTISIIKKIADSAKVIMEMMDVINNITMQTNLLAMNASIESAHAGETGKGFAVVAGEIRKLSENTTKNSKEIYVSLKQVIDYINFSESSARRTEEYFKSILSGVKNVSDGTVEIKNAIHELAAGSDEIMKSLSVLIKLSESAKDSSSQMMEKIGVIKSSMENISIISKDTKTGIEEITSRINEIYNSVQIVSQSGIKNVENVIAVEDYVNKFITR